MMGCLSFDNYKNQSFIFLANKMLHVSPRRGVVIHLCQTDNSDNLKFRDGDD